MMRGGGIGGSEKVKVFLLICCISVDAMLICRPESFFYLVGWKRIRTFAHWFILSGR